MRPPADAIRAAREVVGSVLGRDQAQPEARPSALAHRWAVVASPGTVGLGEGRRCTVNLDGGEVDMRVIGPPPRVGDTVLVLEHGNDRWVAGIRDAGDAEWRYVGGVGQPAFAGAWGNHLPGERLARFRKDAAGWVHLGGTVAGGASTTTVFTLPAGYRPNEGGANGFGVLVMASGGAAQLVVNPTGAVQLHALVGNPSLYCHLNGCPPFLAEQ